MSSTNPTILGHKPGLFLLFFTEMWERFSYYGMRALLVLFLVSEFAAGGWGWDRSEALKLYATYTGLVYLTPIIGGIAADRWLGYRGAVVLGALLMTLGHASLALETEFWFYTGLFLLVAGNGFFKPNISSIVGQLYKDEQDQKDGAYTIFYMGINAGAFLGILLCGYLGEKVGWSFGFGLAGMFMFLGMLMFHFGQTLFGNIGNRPAAASKSAEAIQLEAEQALPPVVVRDRLIVICILSCFTIFFWMAFEQAGGSMTIFAKDYTQRVLSGPSAAIFFWVNTILTVGPLACVTWVLLRMIGATFRRIALSNMAIGLSFVLIWWAAGWMLVKEFNMRAYEVEIAGAGGETVTSVLRVDKDLSTGASIQLLDLEGKAGDGKLRLIAEDDTTQYAAKLEATIKKPLEDETEVPASWFGILNSFFIITFAPLFNLIWRSRLNPSGPAKFAIGLVLLGLGFAALAFGSMGIAQGATTASVSMVWLIIAYLLHTLGELCVSPVGLSYVSKLAPARLVGLMFGIWFLCNAIANYIAGWSGSFIDQITQEYSMTVFFLIFTAVPVGAGLVMLAMSKWLRRMMHGIY